MLPQMNGVHDLGGMHGFGPVARDQSEPPFEFEWVPAVIAMQAATVPAVASIDEFRHAIERMDPVHYLRSTYFEHWLDGMTRYCVEKGVATAEDLAARVAHFEGNASGEAKPLADQSGWVSRRRPGPLHRRTQSSPPRFQIGDAIRTNRDQPVGHTRLARYARGRCGVIVGYRACFVLPDAAAHGREESAHLYSVRFSAAELWGASAEAGTSVFIDLFERYLEPEV